MADKYRYAFVVSFPGGLVDPDDEDDIIMTATRETEEEIGIPRHKIKVLGKFHDVTTTANRDLAISSVLGIL
jgi:8-oxo-dGTP pyrophosphatase MutT (NUDIX family)